MAILHAPHACRLLAIALLLLVAAGCASTPPARSVDVGDRVVMNAVSMVGKPYRFGGSSPHRGFDCSGLVHYAYSQVGLQVPRTAERLYRRAQRISRSELRAGDLVFFRIDGKVSHVGVYTGDGRFVHAPSSGKSVMISSLNNPYWRQRLIAGGRLH